VARARGRGTVGPGGGNDGTACVAGRAPVDGGGRGWGRWPRARALGPQRTLQAAGGRVAARRPAGNRARSGVAPSARGGAGRGGAAAGVGGGRGGWRARGEPPCGHPLAGRSHGQAGAGGARPSRIL